MSDAGTTTITHKGVEFEVVFDGRGSIYPPPVIPPPIEVTDEDRAECRENYPAVMRGAVYAAIEEPATVMTIMRRTGLSHHQVHSALQILRKLGQIHCERIKGSFGSRYSLYWRACDARREGMLF